MYLHTLWQEFLLIKRNTVEIVEDFFLIVDIYVYFYRLYVNLTNINPILKDLNVINEILTNYYSRYQDNSKDFNNIFQRFHFKFWKSMQIFDEIFGITSFKSYFEGFHDNMKKF
jgi:hypothetical protein